MVLRSNEDDEELLIHVPFDGSVKLKAICLIGDGRHSRIVPMSPGSRPLIHHGEPRRAAVMHGTRCHIESLSYAELDTPHRRAFDMRTHGNACAAA